MIPENFCINGDILTIPEKKGLRIVRIPEIVAFESRESGTYICSINKNDSTICKISLTAFAAFLAPRGFFRIHDNCVVNTYYIDRVDRSEGLQVFMRNGNVYDVSRKKVQDFEEALLSLYRKIEGITTSCGTKPTGYVSNYTICGILSNQLWLALYIWQVISDTTPIESYLF